MLANDFQHRRVWKALLVITEQRRRVDAGENRRLPGSALWPAFNAEAGVCRNNNALVDRFQVLVAEYRERFCIIESVQRIERSTRTNSQAINEEKQD